MRRSEPGESDGRKPGTPTGRKPGAAIGRRPETVAGGRSGASTRKKPETMVVKSAEMLRALRTPVRQEIMGALERLGEASVAEVAQALDMKPASLYYHVHDLVRAGLVSEAGTRPKGRKTERLYETSASRIVVDRKAGSRAFADALKGLHRSALRTAEREMNEALESRRSRSGGSDDVTSLLRLSARLSPSDARKARRMLKDVAGFLSERNSPRGTRTYSLTISFVRLAGSD